MATLLNGEVWTTPVINMRIEERVHLLLGTGSFGKLREEARQLVAMPETGSLPVPLRVVGIEEKELDEPER